MIEILAASIIGLLALTTFMFVRKLRKPKPVDEIKLQKIHVMRLGPLLNVEFFFMWSEVEICTKKGHFFTIIKSF